MSKFNVRLFFAGDFCSKPTTSLITVEDNLKELIHSCDIGVINFEVPLKPDGMMPYKGCLLYTSQSTIVPVVMSISALIPPAVSLSIIFPKRPILTTA